MYAQVFEIELDKVTPSVALYPSPDNVVPITKVAGLKLDGCFIGACTTTEEDLILAGLVLKAGLEKGLSLSAGTRHVTPGSLPIVERMEKLGLLDAYERAGFTRGAPGCSYCVGVVDVAPSGSVWLSSQNRNFQDRMGKGTSAPSRTCDSLELELLGSIGHLATATAVAASSFAMEITDPTALLRDIDQSIWSKYKEMVNRGSKIRQEKEVLETIPYSEPNFLPASPETRTVYSQSHDGSPNSTTLPPFSSKAIVVGDYVDTGAVSGAMRILASRNAESENLA